MDSQPLVETDAEIAASTHTPPQNARTEHLGHDLAQAAVGGMETMEVEDDETQPLLSRRRSKSPGKTAEGDTGPGEEQETWDGANDFDGLPWYKRPSIYWLLPPLVLFTMALGGTFVPKINLILALICREYCAEQTLMNPNFHMAPVKAGGENPQCQIPEVQAKVSNFMLYLSLISGILSALVSPRLGSLSDRYGRTKVMGIGAAGMFFSELLTIFVALFPDTLSVNWMLLGSFFDGVGGSFIAAMAIANAYASDCTAPARRHVAFGYYHGCLFLGIALGPLVSGFIVKATGDVLSIFYIAIGANALFFLWVVFVAPESLTKERQQLARKRLKDEEDADSTNWSEATTSEWQIIRFIFRLISKPKKVFAPLAVLWPTTPGTNPRLRRNLVCIAAVDTTLFGVAMGALNVVLIYSELVFGWGTFETSIYVSIVNTCRVTVLVIILPLITRLVRGPASKSNQRHSGCDNIDLTIIRVAIVFDTLGFLGYSMARVGSMFILSGCLAAVGGMGSPTLSAAATKHVPPDQTGKVLGAMGLLHAFARVVAPIIFNSIYSKTVGTMPQTVLMCLAAVFALALVLSFFIRPHVHWDDPYTNGKHPEEEENETLLPLPNEDPQTSRS